MEGNGAGAIITARALRKRYKDLEAVAGISFDVRRGECFGFLGPNGAGKTTTIRMISCVSPVTEGDLFVEGMPVQAYPRKIKSILGVVPQEDTLDPDLTVRQNLRAYARYFSLPGKVAEERIEDALALMQLADKQGDRIDSLSGGLKRRLTIARGLLSTPTVLVLDEPTTGLDPQARHMVWQKLRQLRQQGVTMLLTTHYMEEAAHLCDRIVIMDKGRIIAEGTPQSLIEEHAGTSVVEIHLGTADKDAILGRLNGHGAQAVEAVEDILYVYLRGEDGFDADPIRPDVDRVVYRHANLEDVFLKLTGRGLGEE